MTTLPDRIITYILKRDSVTLAHLETVSTDKGFTLPELYTALETVHRDRRITQTSTQAGEVIYRPAIAKVSSPTPHLEWVRDNYPWPEDFVMPFPEIDMSWLVMSPDEAKEYKAAAKGVPTYIYNKMNGKHPRR